MGAWEEAGRPQCHDGVRSELAPSVSHSPNPFTAAALSGAVCSFIYFPSFSHFY